MKIAKNIFLVFVQEKAQKGDNIQTTAPIIMQSASGEYGEENRPSKGP